MSAPKEDLSLPLAFFIEVAISQIFPPGLLLVKIKKLYEL